MKTYAQLLKTTNKVQLLEILRAALDCQSHFHKPTIVNNDPDFNFGPNPIVLCTSCVNRIREVLDLEDGESVAPDFQMRYKKK